MNVLIIEDEARAASHLERLLKKIAPEMLVIARLESVRDAVIFLSGKPDLGLIFSDVQLADGLSFEIYRQVQCSCPIIFTTAWDHYAIEAFNTNGIDYVLKPVEEVRLRKAIEKSRQFTSGSPLEKLLALSAGRPNQHYKSRFLVKVGDKIKPIPVEDITAFYSLEKATYLFTADRRSYAIEFPLDQLESMVDPARFFRVNRKFLVSFEACGNITAWSSSRLRLRIDGLEDQEIVVARERVQDFKQWLDS